MTKISSDQITACLVTRGDQPEMMRRIHESLIFKNVIVWDNSVLPDWKTAGRYRACEAATTPVVYFQDDDVVVPPGTQWAILAAYEPGTMVANWGHGENPDGYDDLPLVGGGAIVDRDLPLEAERRYLDRYQLDDGYLYDCDFAVGVLYAAFKHVRLPFEINYEVAQHPSRLCNQPWQRALKHQTTMRARKIRDGAMVAA